jgi:hypothetical protein
VHNASVSEHARRRSWWWAYGVAVVLVLGYLWAGYAEGWAWTGLSRRVTLWDWLEGLALPVTVGLVPLLLRHRQHLGPRHHAAGATVLAVFAALVLPGYLVPWAWTGFTGNTLWDWLSLALLPLVIATSTLWHPPPRWTARHRAGLVAGSLVALVIVLCGYLVPWAWTGFTGNTAWNWIKLLLLPLLLPTVVLPRLLDAAEEWIAPPTTLGAPRTPSTSTRGTSSPSTPA